MEKNLLKRLMDTDDPLSVKRFATLIALAFFIIACFISLFIVSYTIFYTIKGKVDIALLNFMEHILWYDFMIVGGGLGLIGLENFGTAMVEKAKAAASAIFSSPSIKTENVENVNVVKENPKPDNPDAE